MQSEFEAEFKVFQVLEKPNEVYNLSGRPFGFSQGERSERWREPAKVAWKLRYELADAQVVYLDSWRFANGED